MNLTKIIESVKSLKNGYDVSDEKLIEYINTVEQTILTDIVKGREGDEDVFENYGEITIETPRDTELFAPAPYEDVYARYCAAMIDLLFEDGERYLNDMAVYRDTYRDLKRYWWRSHRQKYAYAYHL